MMTFCQQRFRAISRTWFCVFFGRLSSHQAIISFPSCVKVLLFLYEKVMIFEQVVIWFWYLVHRRGLSNHFTGKSKSFANLSEVEVGTVKDLEKQENPFNNRIWMENSKTKFCFFFLFLEQNVLVYHLIGVDYYSICLLCNAIFCKASE